MSKIQSGDGVNTTEELDNDHRAGEEPMSGKGGNSGLSSSGKKVDLSFVYIALVFNLFLLLAMWYFMDQRISSAEENQTEFVVADVGEVVSLYAGDRTQDEMDEIFDNINEIIERLANEGYIIINDAAVLDAPSYNKVSASELLERAGNSPRKTE